MSKILVVNAGSSSIKWMLFNKEDLSSIAEGLVERIYVDGVMITKFNGEKFEREVPLNSHEEAAKEIIADLTNHNIISDINEITNIGNRVVQGADIFTESTVLDKKAIQTISDLSPLAPLHNPGAVQAIEAFSAVIPDAVLTATFDTSFHATMDKVNYIYPMNKKLADKLKIRKYGFHGTSHKFISEAVAKEVGKPTATLISLHIGNGASICAIKDGKSIDTSMGLTPLAGIMMGTRSGDIDPSIHAYIAKNTDMSIDEIDTMLNKESGLKGVSGISADARDVLEASENGNDDAKFSLELYAHKIVDYTANYANKLGGKEAIDAIVFTAGLGENAVLMRKMVVDKLMFAKIDIDEAKNKVRSSDARIITTDDSEIPVYIIPTEEELMIARDAKELG